MKTCARREGPDESNGVTDASKPLDLAMQWEDLRHAMGGPAPSP
jgi:hypothetical protein